VVKVACILLLLRAGVGCCVLVSGFVLGCLLVVQALTSWGFEGDWFLFAETTDKVMVAGLNPAEGSFSVFNFVLLVVVGCLISVPTQILRFQLCIYMHMHIVFCHD
jgi:hypothetical protein